MKRIAFVLLVAGAFMAAVPAFAHHSFAATYFEDKNITVEGTLVQFMFRNPHSFVHIEAPDDKGNMETWAVEWGGGGQLSREGVSRDTLKPGDHVITSSVEHHAVLFACKHLQETGNDVSYLPVDGRGLIDPGDVRRALRPNTKLISVMMANNETGIIQPVEEIGKIAAEAGVMFHTDAVQAVGKIPVDVKRIGCHALSLSGHKLHAPQGVGALYVRKGTRLQPLFYGGRHERSRRAGTENVPGIVGLGKAAELAMQGFADGADDNMAALRDRLQQSILSRLEEATINGDGAPRVPNTVNISFHHIEGEAMVIALDLKGLAVSTGAACASGAIEPSHVLTAMGLRGDRARGSIRFSLGKQNSVEDVDFALSLIPTTVARLRDLSPVYPRAAITS